MMTFGALNYMNKLKWGSLPDKFSALDHFSFVKYLCGPGLLGNSNGTTFIFVTIKVLLAPKTYFVDSLFAEPNKVAVTCKLILSHFESRWDWGLSLTSGSALILCRLGHYVHDQQTNQHSSGNKNRFVFTLIVSPNWLCFISLLSVTFSPMFMQKFQMTVVITVRPKDSLSLYALGHGF